MKLPFSRKALVLNLIIDDLTNLKLIYSLNDLGLRADDYTLQLNSTIFKLIGLNTHDRRLDTLTDKYLELTQKVKRLDVAEDRNQLNELSLEIYNYLQSVRRKLPKK
jgi:hypothetical protein